MINTKRPNTSDYIQVGFIEAKDTQGNYQNIDHIYDSQGNIVFQQGYLNEYQGADNFSIPAIGKPLIDYTIYGNMYQASGVSPTTPIQPQETGDMGGNLFDISTLENGIYLAANGNKYGGIADGVRAGTKIKVLPNTVYTLSAQSSANVSLRILEWSNSAFAKQTPKYNISGNVSLTVTTTAETTEFTFNIEGENGQYATNIMLNTGSTTLPYEPYGYKIPISSGGVNLFDQSDFSLLQVTSTAYRYGTSLGVLSQGRYTFNATKSTGAQSIYLTAKLNGVYSQTTISSVPFSFTADGNSEYIIHTASNTGTTWEAEKYSDIMLNLGSTPLPYEPYNRTTTPVYLGEVETTRKIGKLVLDGTEDSWREGTGFFYNQQISPNYKRSAGNITLMCTHYQPYKQVAQGGDVPNGYCSFYFDPAFQRLYIVDNNIASLADFKAYLAQQYANGTPVTVWYVLATETTGIVNEPIRKIGDYADTVSMEQAGVQIPTNKGNTVIDVETEVEPSEVDVTYRGSTKPKYDLFLAQNGDSFEAKDGQSLYIGGDL